MSWKLQLVQGPHVLFMGANGVPCSGITVRRTDVAPYGELQQYEINDITIAQHREHYQDRLGLDDEHFEIMLIALDSLKRNPTKPYVAPEPFPPKTKVFSDGISSAKEPSRPIGTWKDGSEAFESASIYFTHMVRLEKGKTVHFVYDPGKVWRNLNCTPQYKFN